MFLSKSNEKISSLRKKNFFKVGVLKKIKVFNVIIIKMPQ